ncbi:hypothetical protein, partial [Aeromonas rivipollensis]|uniref:hypothetical protein n=1 Tax=Aeromonas rivipollensis TaxID=948519 RepID=UPI0038D258A5
QDARLDTYRCRDAKSGAARETRAGAERGCLKQLCATTILKNAVGREAVSVQVSFLGYFPFLLWIKWKQGVIDFIFLFLLVFCVFDVGVQLIF